MRIGALAAYYWLMAGVENVLATLRANMSTFESLGVRRLGVFGSTVTGEAGPDSDLVPENVLKPAIRPHVERTIRYVA